jgi:cell division protein FtsL
MEGIMAEVAVRNIPRINGISLQQPRLLPLLVFIAVLMGISLFFVWSRLQVVNLEYDISSLEGRLRSLQQESRGLTLEAASLRNPGRVEQVARVDLGLRQPTLAQVVIVD